MFDQHQLFSWADPLFYDTPARCSGGRAFSAFGPAGPPPGWRQVRRDVWTVHEPPDVRLPPQGWKVHVSSRLEHAEHVLRVVAECCAQHGVVFKHLHDDVLLRVYTSKYVPRAVSGKFIAVYPVDEASLLRVVDALADALADVPGPHVLSGLRWGTSPVSVRYGGFVDRRCLLPDGELVLAVERPDGVAVPDLRRPVFSVPDWVPLPAAFAPHVAARSAAGRGSLPYRVLKPLHFSNGGGVYLASRPEDGTRVVLKEARPHCGVDLGGRDAVERLHHEGAVLQRLAGLPGVPRVHEQLTAWEHEFLVVDHVEGQPLWAWLGAVHPMLRAETGDRELAAFVYRALALADAVAALLDRVHERGVVLGDLHPGNLIVREDDRGVEVSLVDVEAAGDAGDPQYRPPFGAPGFLAPDLRGRAVDEYALAALRLWLLLPLHMAWGFDPADVLPRLLTAAEQRFPLPAGYVDELRRTLIPPTRTAPPRRSGGGPAPVDLDAADVDWTAVRDSLSAAVLASATPQRADRLYPGDLLQFTYDGACLAYGAAGVIWALLANGTPVPAEHEQWLLDAARRGLAPRPGLLTGLHGVAHVLDLLGHRDAALELVEQAVPHVRQLSGISLFSGLSGIGLNLLELAGRTGDPGLRAEADAVAGRLAVALEADDQDAPPDGASAGAGRHSKVRAGLVRGWSGPALLFVRMFEDTGDPAWLDAAVSALHRDLDRCMTAADGSLQVHEAGVRTLAHLDGGSGGIAVVADRLARHREDERCRVLRPALVRACSSELVVESQLFMGRAGLLGCLAALRDQGGPEGRAAVGRHLRRLAWHAVSYRGHLAFLGGQSYRLSMDLATGGAGVLVAVAAATAAAQDGEHRLHLLPLVGPAEDRPVVVRPSELPVPRGPGSDTDTRGGGDQDGVDPRAAGHGGLRGGLGAAARQRR